MIFVPLLSRISSPHLSLSTPLLSVLYMSSLAPCTPYSLTFLTCLLSFILHISLCTSSPALYSLFSSHSSCISLLHNFALRFLFLFLSSLTFPPPHSHSHLYPPSLPLPRRVASPKVFLVDNRETEMQCGIRSPRQTKLKMREKRGAGVGVK